MKKRWAVEFSREPLRGAMAVLGTISRPEKRKRNIIIIPDQVDAETKGIYNLKNPISSRYNSANLFVRINGRTLIMLHELVKRRELALPDAVHGSFHVHSEVLVATRSF